MVQITTGGDIRKGIFQMSTRILSQNIVINKSEQDAIYANYQKVVAEVACLNDIWNLQQDCIEWLDEKCRFNRDLARDYYSMGYYEKSAWYHARANRYADSRAAVRKMSAARFQKWYEVAREYYAE